MQEIPMSELTIALAIAVPLGIAALNTWINITIKFAPDAAHARREVTEIFIRVIGWIGNSVVLGQLIWQIISPNPNLRLSFLLILLDSFSLFNSYLYWLLHSVFNLIGKQTAAVGTLGEVVRDLVKIAKRDADST
jgi:hypothetical protein